MPPRPTFDLVVVAGVDGDRGRRVEVAGQAVILGRGDTAALSLADRRISREHAQAIAVEEGVAFAVLPAARRGLSYQGELVERVVVGIGGELQIGDTVLRVEEARASERRADARTLLTGEAEDVRAAAALYGLSEALRACTDRAGIDRVIRAWALAVPVRALEVALAAEKDAGTAERGEITVRPRTDGGSDVCLGIRGTPRLQFVLRYALEPARIAESLQRLLLVAGALLTARLGEIQALDAVRGDRDFVRAMAFGGATSFLGASEAATRLEERIARLSRADVMVLLTGETGTGKTFVARLLHERSARANKPFRAVNCAAIPETLLEAELFGSEKGAFTGATAARAGLFEAAGDGTLFLDEIGELSLAGQAKLLRVLEERRYERIGSHRTLELSAQVVVATNRDLEERVRAKAFREDLFFRVSAHSIAIPPLRERRADIGALAGRFLADLAPARGCRARAFSPDAAHALEAYRWPGNVRELRNAVDHAVVNTDADVVEASALPEAILREVSGPPAEGFAVTLPVNQAWLDERNFAAALEKARGNVTKAAELLGMNRVSLHKRIRRTRT